MTPTEYDRLQKAHQIQSDISFLLDAVSILTKRPRIDSSFQYMSDADLVRTAMERFVTDEDMAEILSRKIDALEHKFKML